MGREQIFGWNAPALAEDNCVKTVRAFRRDDGDIDVETWMGDGGIKALTVPADALRGVAASVAGADAQGGIERPERVAATFIDAVRAAGDNRSISLMYGPDYARVEVYPVGEGLFSAMLGETDVGPSANELRLQEPLSSEG